ncbi:RNA 3'-terminal phosphate cyclase domain-containing protein [Camillea tinctor]|nr:RNA 3'-terminal phosphate cyclase domain-containing protein [Camillea tinctor]
MAPPKPLQIDGQVGEGGGQLVRLACGLAAVTSTPIRIVNVRGRRGAGGARGGGLKAQHVTALSWLAQATRAEVRGLEVGSRSLEFRPTTAAALDRPRIEIVAGSSAASALLVFQAIFPYLLFAGCEEGDAPIEIELHGGTNVAFSLSYEYFDQVLLPTLQARFGIRVERQLRARGWSAGPAKKGCVWLRFRPVPRGGTLKPVVVTAEEDLAVAEIDVSMLVPSAVQAPLQEALVRDLDERFPGVDVRFTVVEDSGHEARMYALLVARTETGGRCWGRDYLYDRARKNKTPRQLAAEISRKVCEDLFEEVGRGGAVDEHLQDQLVVFQALAEGRTSFPRGDEPVAGAETQFKGGSGGSDDDKGDDGLGSDMESLDIGEKRMRKDKTHEPFGEGSLHTTTARWVVSQLLPSVKWFNNGSICDGAGVSFSA